MIQVHPQKRKSILFFFLKLDKKLYTKKIMNEKEENRIAQHLALSGVQEEAVNHSFEKLFGYPWGTQFTFNNANNRDIIDPFVSKQERILLQIFGPDTAAQILLKNPTLRKKQIQVIRKPQYYKVPKPCTATQSHSTTESSSSSSSLKPANVPKKGGVENLLQELSGVQTTTTVAKTHADWGHFKEQSGLADKLEEQVESKAAYLKRQDFLQRVDERKFELEKKERERDRIQRK